MLEWLWPAYAGFIILLGLTAGMVALFVPEDQKDRRMTAFGMVKIATGAGTGITVLTTAAVRFTEAGVL